MRYLGRTGGLSSGLPRMTSAFLGFSRQTSARSSVAKPFVLGKKEQIAITKKLINSPKYVPKATEKRLKDFAKDIRAHRGDYSKSERVFADTIAHKRTIATADTQRKFVAGEAEALATLKERGVRSSFQYTPNSSDIARKTLHSIQEPTKGAGPSIADRRAGAGLAPRGITPQPAIAPRWQPESPSTPPTPATGAPHANAMHHLGSLSSASLQFGQRTVFKAPSVAPMIEPTPLPPVASESTGTVPEPALPAPAPGSAPEGSKQPPTVLGS